VCVCNNTDRLCAVYALPIVETLINSPGHDNKRSETCTSAVGGGVPKGIIYVEFGRIGGLGLLRLSGTVPLYIYIYICIIL